MLNFSSLVEAFAQRAHAVPTSGRTALHLSQCEHDCGLSAAKRVFDVSAAAAALVIPAPLLAALAPVVRLKKVLGRWVARRAERLIAISDAVKRYMCGSGLGVEQRKLQTIHYGIDAARFDYLQGAQAASLRSHWGIAAEELAIGFVGRLVPQKDIGTLIRGFALFAATFAEAKLVIVGIGPLNEELRRSADELGISGRIVWVGFRDDIVTVMSAFDIFALTSIYEGFGLVLLEAMASRLPVVATRVGAITEVVVDGETGILVGPRRPEEVAAAFHKLRDGRLRTRFGEAGRARVLREFTLEKMYQATDALYERCIRRRSIKIEAQIICAVSTVN